MYDTQQEPPVSVADKKRKMNRPRVAKGSSRSSEMKRTESESDDQYAILRRMKRLMLKLLKTISLAYHLHLTGLHLRVIHQMIDIKLRREKSCCNNMLNREGTFVQVTERLYYSHSVYSGTA